MRTTPDTDAQLVALFDVISVGMAVADFSGQLLRVNAALCQMTGYSEAELLARTFYDISHPDDRMPQRSFHDQLTAGGITGYAIDKRYVRQDGQIVWAHVVINVMRDAAGQPLGTVAVIHDITARKVAEEKLRNSEQKLRVALAAGGMGTWIWDLQENTVVTDQLHRALWELDDNTPVVPAEKIFARIHPDDIGRIVTSETAASIVGRFDVEFRILRHNGEIRWLRSSAMPIHSATGQVTQIVGVNFDITDRHLAEQRLRESEERYRATFANAAVGIAHVAPDGRWITFNDAVCEITGYPAAELLQKTFADITHPDDLEVDLAQARRLFAEEISSYTMEKRYIRKDGSIVWVSLTGSIARDRSGEVKHAIAVIQDISKRKQAEFELAEARAALEKHATALEAIVAERTAQLRQTIQQLETFSYSIVHDMRAPLRSMRSFARVLSEDYSQKLDDTGRNYLNRIINSAARMDTLITDVLSYSKITMTEAVLQDVDLDRLVTDLLGSYPQLQDAAAVIEVRRPLFSVRGNAALLTQAISNLLGNAIKFVAPGQQPKVTIRAEKLATTVRVWVEDNGIGIAPEHQANIFALFQRLHAPDKYAGTGVGLAIVKAAVERMRGSVGLESAEGCGSRFWIELPQATGAAESIQHPKE